MVYENSGQSDAETDGERSAPAVPTSRAPGRPRRPATDDAILTATLRVLIELGYQQLTIDAVAVGAGVGRPTIYRRWGSKAALVVAALSRAPSLAAVPDTGTVRGDLLSIQRDQVAMMNHRGFRRTMPGLVADLASDAELAATYFEHYVLPRQEPVRVVVGRAVERGQLADVDLSFICDLLTGPLFYRAVVEGQTLTADLAEDTVRAVIDLYETVRR